jgi:hypothetical protein
LIGDDGRTEEKLSNAFNQHPFQIISKGDGYVEAACLKYIEKERRITLSANKNLKKVRWFEHTVENARRLARKKTGLVCMCGQTIAVGETYSIVGIRKPYKGECAVGRGKITPEMIGVVCHRECFEGFIESALGSLKAEFVKINKKIKKTK